MNTNTVNVLIVGVGGQGSLLASRILGQYYIGKGMDVKVSEVHGMSQRGGSVVTFVRAGARVDAPLVPKHSADLVLSFEQIEGARYLDYLNPETGLLVSSTQRIDPMPVVTGAAAYPADIEASLAASGVRSVFVDAHALAVRAGNGKAANVVMLGAACAAMHSEAALWRAAVAACVPERFADMNLQAFTLGYDSVGKSGKGKGEYNL